MRYVVATTIYKQFFPENIFLEKDFIAIPFELWVNQDPVCIVFYEGVEVIDLKKGDSYYRKGKNCGEVVCRFEFPESIEYSLKGEIIYDEESFKREKKKFVSQFDENNKNHLLIKKQIEIIEQGVFFC